MRCIYKLTIKITNVPFVTKLSHGHGVLKNTYELIQVLLTVALHILAFSFIFH